MKYLKMTIVALVGLALWGLSLPAHAAWDGLFCDIGNGKTDTLIAAVDKYNEDFEEDRMCTAAIRFTAKQTIPIPNGFTITQAPPQGETYGFAIMKCVQSGPYATNVTCPNLSDTDVVLDASGYTKDNGDCPIKIASGAKIDIMNLKLIVRNPSKAICDTQNQPIPLTLMQGTNNVYESDTQNPYAWIYRVTIDPAPVGGTITPLPTAKPDCLLKAVPSAPGGFDLFWETTRAASISLAEGGNPPEALITPSGSRHVDPARTTVYTLTAQNGFGICSYPVTVIPAAPTCEFTPTLRDDGGFDLRWKTERATAVTLKEGTADPADADLSGTKTVTPTQETVYVLAVKGDGGTCARTLTLKPPSPTCEFSAVAKNDSSYDLHWNTTYASRVTLTEGYGDPIDLGLQSKTRNVIPTTTTVYTLSAIGPGGICAKALPLKPQPPACDLKAVPVSPGEYDLKWTATNSTSVTLDDGKGALPVKTADTKRVQVAADTVYTLTSRGYGGQCTAATPLSAAPKPPVTPTCTITAIETQSGVFDLNWSTTNAKIASLSDGSATLSSSLSGRLTVTPGVVAMKYTLTAVTETSSSGAACTASVSVNEIPSPPPPPPPPPTAPGGTFTSTVSAAGGFDLNWNITNAASVTLGDGTTTSNVTPSGAQNVKPAAPTTYTLMATGPGGTFSKSITLSPPVAGVVPTCNFSLAVAAGGGFDLTWSTVNAATVNLSEGTTTLSSAASGTQNVKPASPTTYTLSATGQGGSCSKAISLTPAASVVAVSPTCTLSSSAVAVSSGGGFDLTWTTTNAASASLSDGGASPLSTALNSTSPVHVNPAVPTVFTLKATGAGGVCSQSVTLAPPPNPSVSGAAAPTCDLQSLGSAGGGGFDLTWTTTNAASAVLGDDRGNPSLSTDLNSADPLPVAPDLVTVYTLTATGPGGVCSESLTLVPNACLLSVDPMQTDSNQNGIADVCEPVFAIGGGGVDGGGCGCRISSGTTAGSPEALVPFLAMGLPMLLIRILGRRVTTQAPR